LIINVFQPRLGEVVNEEPSTSRVDSWSSYTSTSFDLLDSIPQLTHRKVACPSCRKFVDVREYEQHLFSCLSDSYFATVALSNEEGTGYYQQKFSKKCSCEFVIQKQSMAVLKLAKVLVCDDGSPRSYLSYVIRRLLYITEGSQKIVVLH
jgi:hypothetical protein